MNTYLAVYEIYLEFERGDIISGGYLERLGKHYRLDTTLSYVSIPEVIIKWDGNNKFIDSSQQAKSWHVAGSTHLYMIFSWLKTEFNVKRVMDVTVDDFERGDRIPHCDQAIIECLKDLQVETWNWQRLDISSRVISKAAGKHVKVLYLYCSGLAAVLESWSAMDGLPRLENVSLQIQSPWICLKLTTDKSLFASWRRLFLKLSRCVPQA